MGEIVENLDLYGNLPPFGVGCGVLDSREKWGKSSSENGFDLSIQMKISR